jgi:hypothetical protein
MRLGVGLAADPAAEPAKTVPVLAEALARSIAAGYLHLLHVAVHKSIIQQACAVCQEALVDFSLKIDTIE